MSKWKVGLTLAAMTAGLILNNEEEIKEGYQKAKNWIKNKLKKDKTEKEETKEEEKATVDVPQKFICPLSGRIMEDPVVSIYGVCFERVEIERYIQSYGKCPVTGNVLSVSDLSPSFTMRAAIRNYREAINR